MPLPQFLQPYLASYDLSALDVEADKELIITEVLNKGNFEALAWLTRAYSEEDIRKVLASPDRGMWMESVLSYWLKIFNIRLPDAKYKQAIVDLSPRQ
jgi:hypothetical protein